MFLKIYKNIAERGLLMFKSMRNTISKNKNKVDKNELCEQLTLKATSIEKSLIAILQCKDQTVSDDDVKFILDKTNKFLQEADLSIPIIKRAKSFKVFQERAISLRQLIKKFPAMIKRHNLAIHNREKFNSRAS